MPICVPVDRLVYLHDFFNQERVVGADTDTRKTSLRSGVEWATADTSKVMWRHQETTYGEDLSTRFNALELVLLLVPIHSRTDSYESRLRRDGHAVQLQSDGGWL